MALRLNNSYNAVCMYVLDSRVDSGGDDRGQCVSKSKRRTFLLSFSLYTTDKHKTMPATCTYNAPLMIHTTHTRRQRREQQRSCMLWSPPSNASIMIVHSIRGQTYYTRVVRHCTKNKAADWSIGEDRRELIGWLN
jgi:hypothetical protein